MEKKQRRFEEESVPTKIWNKTFISVFITNMLMYLGMQMCNTLVGKYANHIGASAAVVGTVTSLFAVTAIVFKMISAPAIDTFNRKYILAGAMVVIATALFGYSLSASIPMLMSFRLLQGAGQAFTATCCLALATDSLPLDRLSTGIGYFSLAQATCQAIGPTIGLKLSDTIGYQKTFAVGACFLLLGAYAALHIKIKFKHTRKFRISPGSIIAKEAIIPAIIMFFLCMAYYNITSFLAIYGEQQGVGSNIGFFFTVYAVTLLFSRPIIGQISDKYGHVRVLIPALCCFALAFLMISFSHNLVMFLISAFISAFGYGACQPAVQALCMKLVPKDKRGAGSCTSYIGQDLGNLVGPMIAGGIVDRMGYSNMWRIMIFPVFLAMIVVILYRKQITEAGKEGS